MLGERLEQDALGHLEAVVEVDEVLVDGGVELVGGHGGEGAVEVIDALDEVLGELLDGKVAGRLDLARGAVLEVAEVGDGAQALVLFPLCKHLVYDYLRQGRGREPSTPWPRSP